VLLTRGLDGNGGDEVCVSVVVWKEGSSWKEGWCGRKEGMGRRRLRTQGAHHAMGAKALSKDSGTCAWINITTQTAMLTSKNAHMQPGQLPSHGPCDIHTHRYRPAHTSMPADVLLTDLLAMQALGLLDAFYTLVQSLAPLLPLLCLERAAHARATLCAPQCNLRPACLYYTDVSRLL
jgi:hypothetical protein